jgi:hypothetical protein
MRKTARDGTALRKSPACGCATEMKRTASRCDTCRMRVSSDSHAE